jgi:hypothetical protein
MMGASGRVRVGMVREFKYEGCSAWHHLEGSGEQFRLVWAHGSSWVRVFVDHGSWWERFDSFEVPPAPDRMPLVRWVRMLARDWRPNSSVSNVVHLRVVAANG